MTRLTAEEAAKVMGLPVATTSAPATEAPAEPKTAPPSTTEPAAPQTPPAPTAETTTETPPTPSPKETPKTGTEDTTPAWYAHLESVDAKELAKHPKVSGLIGDLAAKQARKLAKDAEVERSAKAAAEAKVAEQQRLRELDEVDPYKARDERRALEAKDAEAKAAEAKTVATYQAQAIERIARLTPENQAKLAGKRYAGDADQGYAAFLEDYEELRAEEKAAELTEQRAKRDREQVYKEAYEAAKRELLSDESRQEPAVDVTRGNGVAATHRWTWGEVEKLTADQYAKNKKEILAQLPR